jgi:hypothetical protein
LGSDQDWPERQNVTTITQAAPCQYPRGDDYG